MTERKLNVLVTAGPTREYLDDVRFLTNASSGKMGFAIAGAAARAGHTVTLIAGPVVLASPPGVRREDVVSAEEMRNCVLHHFENCDALVMTAAVCDYRPAKRHPGKIKKDAAELVVRFLRNPDILGEIGARKGNKILIGFALEAQAGEHNALLKLRQKNLDAVVLNGPQAMAADRSTATIIQRNGHKTVLPEMPKEEIAGHIVTLLETLASERTRRQYD